MIAVGLIVLGVGAGILSGMFGIGGGVVIVPALVTFFGFGLQNAVGTSLGALLLPAAGLAVIAYYRAGKLKVRTAALVAVGLIGGTWIGAQIAFGLPADTLQTLYGVFLLYVGWRFIEPRRLLGRVPPAPVRAERADAPALTLLLVGVGAGILSGLFGIGGGIIIVPILVGLLGFDQKAAVGTSLGALLLPVGLPGVLTYYANGQLEPATSLWVALGLLGGALIGARITLALPSATVKRLYGVFLVVVALRFILG